MERRTVALQYYYRLPGIRTAKPTRSRSHTCAVRVAGVQLRGKLFPQAYAMFLARVRS